MSQLYIQHTKTAGMQPFFQPTPQEIAFTPVPPAVQPVGVLPPKLQPYSFRALSLTVTIVCSILNATSLTFGIPAIAFSVQSEMQKRLCQYEKAKKSGRAALVLSMVNMIYTFITVTLAIGLYLGLRLNQCKGSYYRTCRY